MQSRIINSITRRTVFPPCKFGCRTYPRTAHSAKYNQSPFRLSQTTKVSFSTFNNNNNNNNGHHNSPNGHLNPPHNANHSFQETLLGVPLEHLKVYLPPSFSDQPLVDIEDKPSVITDHAPNEFTETFRLMSPYINAHRGKTMVIHLPGELLNSTMFSSTIEDLALISTFGIKLLIVLGSSAQTNERLIQAGLKRRFNSTLHVTGSDELKCAIDAAGHVRARVESCLGRGLINHPTRQFVTVSSGNFIVALPVGVRKGIDYKYTGEVRRLNVKKIQAELDSGSIVLLSNLGYSASGEIFNCMSEQIALKAAIDLGAEKLVFLHNGEEIIDDRNYKIVKTLLLNDATRFLNAYKSSTEDVVDDQFVAYLQTAIEACHAGVRRSHFVSRHANGGLLEELFTRDGKGLMICKDMYEGIRTATTEDIVGIMRLISPLLKQDVLVSRNQEQIEAKVDTFTVVERDGAIIACASLNKYGNYAEIACVAVEPTYKNDGRGTALISYLVNKARAANIEKVFVMTTRTSHYFMERGFQPAELEDLPAEKQNLVDRKRKSKVYIMDLSRSSAIDEYLL